MMKTKFYSILGITVLGWSTVAFTAPTLDDYGSRVFIYENSGLEKELRAAAQVGVALDQVRKGGSALEVASRVQLVLVPLLGQLAQNFNGDLGSLVAVGNDVAGASTPLDAFKTVLKTIRPDGKPYSLSVAYLPWAKFNPKFGPSEEIPLPGIKSSAIYLRDRTIQFNELILENMRSLQKLTYKMDEEKARLLGFTINGQVTESSGEVVVQALVVLEPGEYPMDVVNDEVTITHFVVPEVSEKRQNNRTLALVEIRQDLFSATPPALDVRFGSWARWKNPLGDDLRLNIVNLEAEAVSRDPDRSIVRDFLGGLFCFPGQEVVPYLKGSLNEEAAGFLFNGREANFYIHSVTSTELHQNKLSSMDLRFGVGESSVWLEPFGCIHWKKIDNRFRDEVNGMIEAKIADSQNNHKVEDEIIDMIFDTKINGEALKFPGLSDEEAMERLQ